MSGSITRPRKLYLYTYDEPKGIEYQVNFTDKQPDGIIYTTKFMLSHIYITLLDSNKIYDIY